MKPPFYDSKIVHFSTEELLQVLPRKVLFQGRWGFTQGNLSDSEYKEILDSKAIPGLEKLITQEKQFNRIQCKAVYAYYKCKAENNSIKLYREEAEIARFHFPRQNREPNLCISDFVKKDEDIIAFFATTIGSKIIEAEQELFQQGSYYDYHLLHGFGAEMADSGAVVLQNLMAKEIGLEAKDTKRFSFGYPACPDLTNQELLFKLLEPSRIDLSLTQSQEMVPELSVSGFVLFNPEARYFLL